MKELVSVIIPALNEKETLEKLVKNVLSQKKVNFEIIIVDDGSIDGTNEIADKLAKRNKLIKVVHHASNEGKGAAVKSGIERSRGEIILIQDADLEYSPTDYLKLLKPFSDPLVSVVYGTREKIARKGIYSNYWFYIGGELVTMFTNILYNTNISDEAVGYKLFRRNVIQNINLESKGFDFCPEITAKIALRGIKIHEVPIHYYPRSFAQGKKIRAKDGILALWTLLKYRISPPREVSPLTAGLEVTQSAKNYNRWIGARIRSYVHEPILEAGAGIGTFADLLLDYGFKKLILCDYDPAYVTDLKNKYQGLKNIHTLRTDLSNKYQVNRIPLVKTIISINTLEHIRSDTKAISNLSSRLEKNGYIIIFVPAMRFLYGDWDKSIGHFRRYDKHDLINKTKLAGLKIIECKYFNFPGVFGWWINKILRSTPDKRSTQNQIIFYDKYIVPWWSIIEEKFNPPIGQSLILIAQK